MYLSVFSRYSIHAIYSKVNLELLNIHYILLFLSDMINTVISEKC